MSFSRKFLVDNGVPEDKVDVIMAERNRTLTDYVPKSDVDTQIQAALLAAQKDAPTPNVTESNEYKTLLAENIKIKALQTEDFISVKPNYRDMVYGMLDHGDKHKPYAEQMTAVREKYGEMFEPVQEQENPPTKPQFGAPPAGSAPKGEKGPSFMDTWNFVPKKQE